MTFFSRITKEIELIRIHPGGPDLALVKLAAKVNTRNFLHFVFPPKVGALLLMVILIMLSIYVSGDDLVLPIDSTLVKQNAPGKRLKRQVS